MDAHRFQYLILTVICFALALSLTAGLTGCASTDAENAAYSQAVAAQNQPRHIIKFDGTGKLEVFDQSRPAPIQRPTNGYDMVMGITNNLTGLVSQNAAVLGMGLLAKSLKSTAQPGDTITTTNTSSSSTNNEANQANTSTQSYSDSSQHSSSQSLQNSGQIAGGDASDTHSPVSTTTTTTTTTNTSTDNSDHNNPVTTNPQTGAAQ